ncbi:MAG: hypothetical protein ACK4ND_16900 [Cytophagaceae bacterium]
MQLSISKNVHLVEPGDFEPTDHWYPRVLNSNIHPLVSYFLNLSQDQIIERYHRIHPKSNPEFLKTLLKYQPTFFRWAGTDLMHVTNCEGKRMLTVIETNSCPSGQKSMPLLEMNVEQGGYRRLIEQTFKPIVEKHTEKGVLAVVYDKNPMENIGYAATFADVMNENVYLVQYKVEDGQANVKFENNKMFIFIESEGWVPVRAAFRYVTQNPWELIPLNSKTLLMNPIEACLAGGRNKEEAYRAYQKFNQQFKSRGVDIFTPQTFLNVHLNQLPEYFHQLGGCMVIKVPDSNAGQGVMTITSEKELEQAMVEFKKLNTDNLLIQQLIYSNSVDHENSEKVWYHVGTVPDVKGRSYAFDIRMMLHTTEEGLRPLAAYSRRARLPLNQPLPEGESSWEVFGTNLSVKSNDGWAYDDARLLLFDVRNFGYLGIGIDELIKGFMQSCMAVYSIDQHAIEKFKNNNELIR